jgi:hypothetical protein
MSRFCHCCEPTAVVRNSSSRAPLPGAAVASFAFRFRRRSNREVGRTVSRRRQPAVDRRDAHDATVTVLDSDGV